MDASLKNKIIKLRNKGKTYNQISNELKCSKATISYHCKIANLAGGFNEKLKDELISNIIEYYKLHTLKETSEKFNVSHTTIKKYSNRKKIVLTTEQKRIKNYERVRSYRQKIKRKAIEYKGGKCQRCGYDKSIWALEFHHMNTNEKDFGISSYGYLAWNKIMSELDKCELICANCHREIHHINYENLYNIIKK